MKMVCQFTEREEAFLNIAWEEGLLSRVPAGVLISLFRTIFGEQDGDEVAIKQWESEMRGRAAACNSPGSWNEV